MTDMRPDDFRAYVARHVERYLATDGEDGAEFNGVPCVILTTVGARTGEVRYSPVVRVPVPSSEDWVVVGSMGGAPKDPAWCHNIRANPEQITLQDRATKRAYRATETSGGERATLWKIAAEVYPPYLEYQTRTDRLIPVFRLTPID